MINPEEINEEITMEVADDLGIFIPTRNNELTYINTVLNTTNTSETSNIPQLEVNPILNPDQPNEHQTLKPDQPKQKLICEPSCKYFDFPCLVCNKQICEKPTKKSVYYDNKFVGISDYTCKHGHTFCRKCQLPFHSDSCVKIYCPFCFVAPSLSKTTTLF